MMLLSNLLGNQVRGTKMNISHTSSNDHQFEEEFNYVAILSSTQSTQKNEVKKVPLVNKILTLLCDKAPSYVLGYN